MNAFINRVLLLIVCIILYSGSILIAQDGNIVYVQTWEFEMPEDGSWEEFDSLETVLNENVLSKNPKILSQRIVRHLWGSNSDQLIVIREYAKIEDLVVDDGTGNKLFEASWKTEDERKAFGKAWLKYWQGNHSDEIYEELPSGRK